MELSQVGAPSVEPVEESRVGVVIATRDRSVLLQRTLRRLVALPEAPAVLVVDDGSRDDTAVTVAASFPDVALTSLGRSRGAAARNVGVECSAAPYVALTDDDAHWAPGALAAAAAVLDRHPRVALIAPQILVGPEERLDPVSAEMARGGLPGDQGPPGERVLGFLACAAVIRRSAFLEVGGFDERYGVGGEERLLALDLAAAGWDLRYVPSVVAHHHPPASADRPGRRIATLRNDLWTAWLRRPVRAAVQESTRRVRDAGPRRTTASAVGAALLGAHWVARERRVLPAHVEAWLTALERSGVP